MNSLTPFEQGKKAYREGKDWCDDNPFGRMLTNRIADGVAAVAFEEFIRGWFEEEADHALLSKLRAEGVQAGDEREWPEIELTPDQEADYAGWVGSDTRTGLPRLAVRLALKLNRQGNGLIDYGPAITFAKELNSIIRAALASAPVAKPWPVAVLRFERGTPGRENEMPRVVSCNRMPDGDYPVYAAPQASSIKSIQKNPDFLPSEEC